MYISLSRLLGLLTAFGERVIMDVLDRNDGCDQTGNRFGLCRLLEKLRDFLHQLGAGSAFVGSQYHLEVGGEDFYLGFLFYQWMR